MFDGRLLLTLVVALALTQWVCWLLARGLGLRLGRWAGNAYDPATHAAPPHPKMDERAYRSPRPFGDSCTTLGGDRLTLSDDRLTRVFGPRVANP